MQRNVLPEVLRTQLGLGLGPGNTASPHCPVVASGESMITESKCSPSERMKSLNRLEPSSSAGFGGIRPAVSSHRPGTLLLRIEVLDTSV